VDENQNLRVILAQNIRTARQMLHLTQEKLAESADISLPYMTDIERCRTWVSDKTLLGLAKALNTDAFQLLVPQKDGGADAPKKETETLYKTAELIKKTKVKMKKSASDELDALLLEIMHLYQP
jgi:transcriptional regulator with XRE-family HTH domain